MAEVSLTAAFSTVPAAEAEEIQRVIVETVQQLAQDDGAFKKARIVFTESDERCGLTAALDGAVLDTRLGDCWAPVGDDRFDLVCTNPPQMPTPSGRARRDATAAADNGGVDGWEILDRVIGGARAHLQPRGRLVFTIFAFLGLKRACAKLEAAGLEPTVGASELQSFPRSGYVRLEHIRVLAARWTR